MTAPITVWRENVSLMADSRIIRHPELDSGSRKINIIPGPRVEARGDDVIPGPRVGARGEDSVSS